MLFSPGLERVARLLAVVAGFLAAAALMARLGQHLTSRHHNHAAEANGLYGLLELSDGRPLYPSPGSRPYHVFLYGPVQPAATAVVIRALGLKEISHRVLAARLLCLLAALVAVAVLWRGIARPLGIPMGPFLLALLLASPRLVDYATTSRNDTWALAAEIAAVAAFLKWRRDGRHRWIALCLALGWLSLFTRQTGVFAVGGACLWLLFAGRRATALALGAIYAAGTAALVFLAQWATRGAFLDHVWYANLRDNPAVWAKLAQPSFLAFFSCAMALFVLAALGAKRALTGERREAGLYLALVAGTSFAAGLALIGRAGGDTNYLLEPVLLLVVPAAMALDHLRRAHGARLLVAGQCAVIAAVTTLKIQSASRLTGLDYAAAARAVAERLPAPGILAGSLAPALGVHVRGWAFHGPDVSNHGQIARHAHPRLKWIARDLRHALRSGEIRSLAIAQPDCGPSPAHGRDIAVASTAWPEMRAVPSPIPWLCLYRMQTPETPPVLSRAP